MYRNRTTYFSAWLVPACIAAAAALPAVLLLAAKADVQIVSNEQVEQVVAGNNDFAFELYKRLAGDPKACGASGNLFFSPYSISTALAMTYAGARGETAAQMAETLHFELAEEQFHQAFGLVVKRLNEQGEKGDYELAVANAVWGQRGYRFLEGFLEMTRRNYGAGLNEVDFAGATEEARRIINTWVEERTKEKIKELIKPRVLGRETTLVLTNAIYFKGDWASKFEEDNTKPVRFYVNNEKSSEVEMMYQQEEFKYAETDELQLLELPYKGSELSMIVLLPKQVEGLAEVEESLTAEKINVRLGEMHKRKVQVYLPRFKLTWGAFELKDVFKRMGMADAFSPGEADFSGMTGGKELFISNIVHKAFVEVNEEGTEAAAATGVGVALTAIVEVPVFRVDHPFVFIIRDNRSGGILFMGRVADPAAGV